MTPNGLRPTDLNQFAQLGILPELLYAASVQRVTDAEARDRLSSRHRGDLSGILFVYLDPENGSPVTCRVRRDNPEMENGKPKDKYLSAYRDNPHLYFPPGAGALLADISVPVVPVESEKSGLAVTAAALRVGRPVLAIALGGCWGWRGRTGKTENERGVRVDERGPLPDLAKVTWKGRDVVILFDSNAATNNKVQAAQRALAAELTQRGAHVRIAELPGTDAVNGPDDYLSKRGDAALFAVIDGARPVQPASAGDALCIAGLDDLNGVTLPELEGRLRLLKDGLHGADAIRRRTVREMLVAALKAAKIGGAAALADAAVGSALDETDHGELTTDFLADDVPWPESVDGAALLEETAIRIRRHVVLTETQADAVALWLGASHAIDGLSRMPMLLLTSTVSECGKTTVETLLSGLVTRPVMVSNLTPAVLFRLIDRYKPTLIADEADTWLNDERSELRGVFNCAHWRTGAVIPRCVGDDHEVRLFNVFGAKVIAMIGRPPATMLSRCITILLHRKTANERVEPLLEDCLRGDLAPLRQRWRRWTADVVDKLRTHEPDMPAALPVNRASDNWRPLLSIADLAGGGWPARGRAAALVLSGVRISEDEPVKVMLLSDVQAVFRSHNDSEYLSSEEIIASLKALPERPWIDWNKGRGLTAAQLASHLRDFGTGPEGLRTRETRIGDKTGKRWHRTDFIDAWSRYVTADPQHPQQTNETRPPPVISDPQHGSDVADQKISIQSMFTGPVADVAATEPDPGAGEVSSPEGVWLDL